MNLAASMLGLALVLLGMAVMAALVSPADKRTLTVGVATTAAGAAAVLAGAAAMAGQTFSVAAPWMLPLAGFRMALDPLGGLFVAVTGAVTVAAAVFGIGYTRHGLAGRAAQTVVPLFVAAMLLVPAADSVGTFLVCWELMAVASLVVVLAEHRRRAEVREAGLWYGVMTHLGFIAILIGLLVFAAHAADDSFAALRAAGPHLAPGPASLIFLATLLGFAAKAGIAPLHAWLPRAHPEAPSHGSALMSAAMVNLGVYGLVRVGLDLLGGGPRWWWPVVLLLGAVSAVYGILQAAITTDLKRLLGYSTTENMGLVLIGVGAAGTFAADGQRVLAGLALAAALLHVINHAAFKTLLFLSAGSVLHATGTRDLDALGGLRPGMPVTTGLFGLGALAASALPLGAAFVSEWLLLQSLVHGLPPTGVPTAILLPVAVAAIALTAGLAVATFVKAFGVGFLAKPRGEAAARAAESPRSMLAGMSVAGVACVVLALAPAVVLPAVGSVASSTVGSADPAVHGAVTLQLSTVAGSLSPLLLALALLAAAVAAVGGVRALATRRVRRTARLWDCGGGPLTARVEYTATSFAEPLQRVFDDVLQPELDVDVTHATESRYLVQTVEYRRRVPDRIERRLYQPVLTLVAVWGRAARGLATGSVHRYLGYGFYAVTALLIVLAVLQ
jgi:hydrogenase-4 component B